MRLVDMFLKFEEVLIYVMMFGLFYEIVLSDVIKGLKKFFNKNNKSSVDIKEIDEIDIKEVQHEEVDIKEVDDSIDIKEVDEVDIKEVSPLSSKSIVKENNGFDPMYYVSLFGEMNVRDALSKFTVGEVIEMFY